MCTTKLAKSVAAAASPTVVRGFRSNQKGEMVEEKKVMVRIAASADAQRNPWESGFKFSVGHEPGNMRDIVMNKVQCTDCKGSGRIMLFSSDAPCDRCLEQGFYFEGVDDEQ